MDEEPEAERMLVFVVLKEKMSVGCAKIFSVPALLLNGPHFVP